MNTKILYGKPILDQAKEKLIACQKEFTQIKGSKPTFIIVVNSADPASKIYVRNKIKDCGECGILAETIEYEELIALEDEVLKKTLLSLFGIPNLCGFMCQLPAPGGGEKVLKMVKENIPSYLDVDGMFDSHKYLSCTPSGIMALLNYYDEEVAGTNCLVIGRSIEVGRPLAKILLNKDATVTVAHSHTKNLKHFTLDADYIFCAAGKKNLITKDMVHPNVTIIDIGINRNDSGKICGDADFENLSGYVKGISPVPGGIGLTTRSGLLYNIERSLRYLLK